MVYFFLLRGLTLGLYYILISEFSTTWLKKYPDPIGLPLKTTELLTWHIFPIYLIIICIHFVPLSYPITLIPIPERSYVKC